MGILHTSVPPKLSRNPSETSIPQERPTRASHTSFAPKAQLDLYRRSWSSCTRECRRCCGGGRRTGGPPHCRPLRPPPDPPDQPSPKRLRSSAVDRAYLPCSAPVRGCRCLADAQSTQAFLSEMHGVIRMQQAMCLPLMRCQAGAARPSRSCADSHGRKWLQTDGIVSERQKQQTNSISLCRRCAAGLGQPRWCRAAAAVGPPGRQSPCWLAISLHAAAAATGPPSCPAFSNVVKFFACTVPPSISDAASACFIPDCTSRPGSRHLLCLFIFRDCYAAARGFPTRLRAPTAWHCAAAWATTGAESPACRPWAVPAPRRLHPCPHVATTLAPW